MFPRSFFGPKFQIAAQRSGCGLERRPGIHRRVCRAGVPFPPGLSRNLQAFAPARLRACAVFRRIRTIYRLPFLSKYLLMLKVPSSRPTAPVTFRLMPLWLTPKKKPLSCRSWGLMTTRPCMPLQFSSTHWKM